LGFKGFSLPLTPYLTLEKSLNFLILSSIGKAYDALLLPSSEFLKYNHPGKGIAVVKHQQNDRIM
jgi:hypothetical protein